MEYVKGLNGKFLRSADGKIPASYFENESSDRAVEDVARMTIQERIANIEKLGVPIPQHMLDELYEQEGLPPNIKGK